MSMPPLTSLDGDGTDDLAAAEARIRSECGWHVAPSWEQTVTFDRPRGCSLMLPSLRVTDVTSVTVDDVELVDGVDYEWSQDGIIDLYAGYSWWLNWSDQPVYGPRRRRTVQVTFTHGYDECPADLQSVVASYAKRGVAAGVSQQSAGPFSVTYSDAPVDEIVGQYKLPPRP